ncbi:MAG: C-terminal binding protein [Sphaerochaeta sp.]|jgi:D-3-phosphoglycerate dehydrogenase|nr:C-terminal binding protein [Sphaerochaeta sp.]
MKILITDMLHTSDEQERAVCKRYGCELDTTFCHNEEDLINCGKDADAFLVSYSKITRNVLESLPNLKIVVKYGIGVDNIDVQAASEHQVMVANVPDYCLEEVASHALMLIMNGLKQAPFFDRKFHESVWISKPNDKIIYRPSEISIGLVSYGRISKMLARYAQPLFKEVCFYDPYIRQYDDDISTKVQTLGELFERCTVISIHTPLTAGTKYIINAELISKLKGGILVNTSRADVVDPQAVVEGLNQRHILFYGADTFWPEPPDFDSDLAQYFLNRTDVLITPHCAWCSLTSEKDVRRKATEIAIEGAKGKCPPSVLNSHALKRC